jgi:hypothetical protein
MKRRYLARRILLAVMVTVWVVSYVRLCIPDACMHPLTHILALLVVVLLPMAVVACICEEES